MLQTCKQNKENVTIHNYQNQITTGAMRTDFDEYVWVTEMKRKEWDYES